jgi:hypothetical protein
MAINVVCPWCSKKITAPDSMAGKSAKCPGCQGALTVPSASAPPSGGIGPPPGFGAPANIGPPPGFGTPANIGPPPSDAAGGAQPPVYDVEDYSTEPTGLQAQSDGEERRPCPACGEFILASAVKCRYCGEVFDSSLRRSSTGRKRSDDGGMSTFDWVLVILCPGIGCIVAIVRLIQGKKSAGKMLGISIAMTVFWNLIGEALKKVGENQRRR